MPAKNKSPVRAIPVLMLKNAGKAIDHYKKAFGAEQVYRMDFPGTDKVAHASIKIGETEFFISEENAERGCAASPGQSFYIYVPDADHAFETAKKAGLKEVQPVTDQFWGDRTGTLSDAYGLKWSVATHVRDVSPKELEEAMKKMCQKAA
jgi:PhnB protein